MTRLNERAGRALAALRAEGLETALLSSAHNVCYVSGYEVPIETGPSPFSGGPALALLTAEAVILVVSELEEAAARGAGADEVVAYPAFSHLERHDQGANAVEALRRALRAAGSAPAALGIEPSSLPWHFGRALTAAWQGVSLVDAGAALARARAVKTADEVALLRRAIALTDVGQAAARRLLRAGMTEAALFGGIRAAIEAAAGRRLPLACDVVSGPERTAAVGGWPTDRAVGPGDLVLVDLGPRWRGYWGDSCNTLCAGEPGAEHLGMLRATTEALARGIEAARPGIRACDLDAVCRGHVRRYGYAYPHHSGHGLGTTPHEAPRVVPVETMPLEAGMVIALEPGAYVPGVGGVRSEHVLLVTAEGAEVLSAFEHGF